MDKNLTPLQKAFIKFSIELAKVQIARDMAYGQVPSTITNFADLHDHVDANTYGLLCDLPEDVGDLIFPRDILDDPEALQSAGLMDAGNDIQTAVGQWLAERNRT